MLAYGARAEDEDALTQQVQYNGDMNFALFEVGGQQIAPDRDVATSESLTFGQLTD